MYCDKIVGIYVNPFEKVKIKDLKHSYTIMERAYKIRMGNESFAKFEDCDLLISPKNLKNYSTFSMKDIDIIFSMGYETAKEALTKNGAFKSPLAAVELEVINGFSIDDSKIKLL